MCQCRKQCAVGFARKAQQLLDAGDSAGAYKLICRAKMEPHTNPGLWFLRARMGMAANCWAAALADIEALERVVDPRDKIILAHVECLLSLERTREAEALLRRYDDRLKRCCQYDVLQARLSAQANRAEAMIDHLQHAMEKDADLATSLALTTPELAFWALSSTRDGAFAEAG